MIENDVTDLGLNFTYQNNTLGQSTIIDLIPNGSEIMVTESNKLEFISLMT